MKKENWQMSYDKWNPETGVLSELNKDGRISWKKVTDLFQNTCGHCVEQNRATTRSCGDCTLNNFLTCGYVDHPGSGFKVFKSMVYKRTTRNKHKARAIANRIFKQIMKDKEGAC